MDDVVMAVCEDKVSMTSNTHKTATDRVAEAARILGYVGEKDIVINVQGDEPVVPPPVIEITRQLVSENPKIRCANMVEAISDAADLNNHHRVKAVISRKKRLIYLTRQAIPSTVFDIEKRTVFYRQTCVMAFRGDFLQYVGQLERTPLEMIEGIDMLRLIENDYPIASGISPHRTHPVDTPDDVSRVEKIMSTDKWFSEGYKRLRV